MAIQKFGKYEIIRPIGQGTAGTVYQAFDPIIDRCVALKIISGEHIEHPEFHQRFKKEVQAQGRVLHPNVAVIFDVNILNGKYVIVMEYVDGQSLREVIDETGVFPLRLFFKVVSQICSGLWCAHCQGVVHRDIKPDNIFLCEKGAIKILDFSIAKIQSSTTKTGMNFLLGSAHYMSPEQILGEKVTPASDQFALGVLCVELLTGRRPFEAENIAESILNTTRQTAPAIHKLNPMVDSELNEIIQRSLMKDASERFPTVAHMRKTLTEYFVKLDPSIQDIAYLDS